MTTLPQEIGKHLGFRSVMDGRFMAMDGSARRPEVSYCNKKLCFAATDIQYLAELLHKLSEDSSAFFVKFSTTPRDGMYLGRCFFIDEESVGKAWAKYKNHPKVFCNIQDDDFSAVWREQVKDWSAPQAEEGGSP